MRVSYADTVIGDEPGVNFSTQRKSMVPYTLHYPVQQPLDEGQGLWRKKRKVVWMRRRLKYGRNNVIMSGSLSSVDPWIILE